MTLLRRAPREVYRVYSEEEFFAWADRDEHSGSAGAGGERRMQRLAGVTMLLAATGAMGGLIAITGMARTAGARRRASAGLLSATRSLISAQSTRARVWREPPGTDGSGGLRVPGSHVARRASRVMLLRRELALRSAAATGLANAAGVTPTIAVREQRLPIAVAKAVEPMRVTASTAATPQPSGQAEFGFER
jgi:hypothetical protein